MSVPNDPITRRWFLTASAALVAAACGTGDDGSAGTSPTSSPTTGSSAPPPTVPPATNPTVPVPELTHDPFAFGVASGDPLPDAVVIWTRLAPDDASAEPLPAAPVGWEIATDESFTDIVDRGEFVTDADRGHSVHVDVTGLDAAQEYHYRFTIGEWTSPTGRTRTAPATGAPTESLRLVVASCAAWKSGYFTAYGHIADEADLDAVLFLGDYIYELESGRMRDHGLPIPFTLDDYRAYYALARREPELAAAHARHPWIVLWDDHEVEDNYAGWEPGGIGDNLDPTTDFRARRIAAYQAWWEFMPVRTGPPVEGELVVYRDFAFGDLARLAVIDDRQYRSPIVTGEGDGDLARPFGGGPLLEGSFDPTRTMLGAEQEQWLADRLQHDQTWTLLAQQTIMAQVDRAPDDPSKGFSMDAWDGYVAPRERLLGAVHDAGVENFVVLGGDIHTSAVADLHVSYREDGSPMVGTEFVSPSITSLELLLPEFVEGSRRNPHIHLYETEHRGYLFVEVTPEQLVTEFRWVDTTLEPGEAVSTASSWRVQAGRLGVEQL
ncbi:MAG: alkaline phosphatase D family protein [Acidimicrobiales bacterium]